MRRFESCRGHLGSGAQRPRHQRFRWDGVFACVQACAARSGCMSGLWTIRGLAAGREFAGQDRKTPRPPDRSPGPSSRRCACRTCVGIRSRRRARPPAARPAASYQKGEAAPIYQDHVAQGHRRRHALGSPAARPLSIPQDHPSDRARTARRSKPLRATCVPPRSFLRRRSAAQIPTRPHAVLHSRRAASCPVRDPAGPLNAETLLPRPCAVQRSVAASRCWRRTHTRPASSHPTARLCLVATGSAP